MLTKTREFVGRGSLCMFFLQAQRQMRAERGCVYHSVCVKLSTCRTLQGLIQEQQHDMLQQITLAGPTLGELPAAKYT